MKQFDEEFSRKAKEAFESFNADHLAGEGWDSFAGKYGRKRKSAFIIPLWARVASVAAILTIVVLLTNRIYHTKADEPGNQLAKESRSKLTESAINKADTASANLEITAAKPLTPSASLAITAAKSVTPSESPVTGSPEQASGVTISKSGQNPQAGREKSGYKTSETAGPGLAEAAGIEGMLLAENSEVAKMSPEMKLHDNPLEIRLTDDKDTRLKLEPKEALHVYSDIPREKMTTTIMTGLSGMIASVDNAASASQGVSIGFYVEQQLSRRISVRPGLAMARHNYALESTSGGNLAMDYSAPELDGMTDAYTSYDAEIDVVSMEVPVNFVFSIRKRARSNLFVTTGASTVFYLSQQISGNINNTYTRSTVDSYGKVSYESMTTSVMIESGQEPLSRVDILGLANFSAGYSFPFAKTSHLLFEPFVQLPVRDLTSLNLRIRYGGLSMKLQF